MDIENKPFIIFFFASILFIILMNIIFKKKLNTQLVIIENEDYLLVKDKKDNKEKIISKALESTDLIFYNKNIGRYAKKIKIRGVNFSINNKSYFIYENKELFKVLLFKASKIKSSLFLKPTVEYFPLKRKDIFTEEDKIEFIQFFKTFSAPNSLIDL